MATVDDAIKSQLRNIERATGRSVEEWVALVRANGKERHGEIVAWLKAEHGFSHGNAKPCGAYGDCWWTGRGRG